MPLQIFGTRKCSGTRAAQRFFSERRVPFHFVDLHERGMSKGELESVARAVGGLETLYDADGTRARDRGLHLSRPTGPRLLQALTDDPKLLRTPIVRDGKKATVGAAVEAWLEWLKESS
jgi:arsenate reductase (glutaredoxin)